MDATEVLLAGMIGFIIGYLGGYFIIGPLYNLLAEWIEGNKNK